MIESAAVRLVGARAVKVSPGYQPWGVAIPSETYRKLPPDEMARRSCEATMAQFVAADNRRDQT
jgi:hypothetical protein